MRKFEVFFTEPFEKSLRNLAKKYKHIKKDIAELSSFLEDYPDTGVAIPSYAHKVWKIRWKSRDMARGKRGSYRIIYLWESKDDKVYLLLIYAKTKMEEITKEELENALREAGLG
ncbi:hypothetical protein HY792_00675 [Candidatus Desantisbacteria bacterium]|nr:hypothetical protein [Candidatus Desantisbacteria bacterium]